MTSGESEIDLDQLKTVQYFERELGNILGNIEIYIEEEY